MNISADTIAIILTIAVAVSGGAWAIGIRLGRIETAVQNLTAGARVRDEKIDELARHVGGMEKRVGDLEISVQNLTAEIKTNRRQVAHHRHHTTGEVYYERDIVNDETKATARQ